MHGTKEFDVIQTLDQGEQCHIVLNRIPGRTLEEICREDGCISKQEFYDWMEQAITHLEHLHRCRPVRIYQFLTPYSIVIGNNGKVFLIDTEHENNREIVRRHFDRRVQSAFFPEDSQEKRHPGVRHDLFAAAKSMQYVLAKCSIAPALGATEERRLYQMLKKTTSGDMKKAPGSAREMRVLLMRCKGREANPESSKEKKLRTGKWKKYALVSAAVIAAAAGGQEIFTRAESSRSDSGIAVYGSSAEELSDKVSSNPDTVPKETEASLNEKLGLLYFRKLQEYEVSIAYFAKAEPIIKEAGIYELLAKYRCGTYGITDEEVRPAVSGLLELLNTDSVIVHQERVEMSLDLIRVLEQLEDMEEEAALIERCLDLQAEWKVADTDGSIRKELYERGVGVYTRQEKWEEAAAYQRILFEEAGDANDYDKACLNLGTLYLRGGKYAEGEEISLEGVKKCRNRTAAVVNYIKNVCKNPQNSQKRKEEKLSDILIAAPEAASDAEFQKVQKEEKFTVKEGKACFK